MAQYNATKLSYQLIYNSIVNQWTDWAIKTNTTKVVIGISGGKDSSVVATIAVRIFGKENVYGVLMPQTEQENEAYMICEFLGIKPLTVEIGTAVNDILSQFNSGDPNSNNLALPPSEQTKTNLPARIRMATLYAVAQTVGGKVINTCNLSEDMVGYSTLFGDDCGAYAPLKDLTATEVKYLGKHLGLPEWAWNKTPSDGLCGKTDEDNLGFTYEALDEIIRTGETYKASFAQKVSIYRKHWNNRFKTQLIRLPYPKIDKVLIGEDQFINLANWLPTLTGQIFNK